MANFKPNILHLCEDHELSYKFPICIHMIYQMKFLKSILADVNMYYVK